MRGFSGNDLGLHGIMPSSLADGICAPLRLALSNTIDLRSLISPLSQLMEALPGVELKFFRGDGQGVAEALKSGDFELGIAGPLPSDWDRFRSWPLFHSSFQLAVHRDHPVAKQSSIPLSQLREERMISRPYCEMADEVMDILKANGITIPTSNVVATDHDVIALLMANMGVAILPSVVTTEEEVVLVPVQGLDKICTVYLYSVAGRRYSPAANAMVRILRSNNWKKALDLKEARAA